MHLHSWKLFWKTQLGTCQHLVSHEESTEHRKSSFNLVNLPSESWKLRSVEPYMPWYPANNAHGQKIWILNASCATMMGSAVLGTGDRGQCSMQLFERKYGVTWSGAKASWGQALKVKEVLKYNMWVWSQATEITGDILLVPVDLRQSSVSALVCQWPLF